MYFHFALGHSQLLSGLIGDEVSEVLSCSPLMGYTRLSSFSKTDVGHVSRQLLTGAGDFFGSQLAVMLSNKLARSQVPE